MAYPLKNGKTLRRTVDDLIQDIMALPFNQSAINLIYATLVFEKRWIDDKYVILPDIEKSIADMQIVDPFTNTKLNDTPLVQRTGIKISPFFAAWVKAVAKNKQWYLAMVGTFAYYFYETHRPDEWVTLSWVVDYIGAGKDISSAFGLKMVRELSIDAPLTTDGSHQLIFDFIEKEDFFNHG